MSQIPSEYVIPEGAHNPNSQDITERLIVISPEIANEDLVFESETKEINIATARLEMGEQAIFRSLPEQITDLTITRIYYLTEKIHQARKDYLRSI